MLRTFVRPQFRFFQRYLATLRDSAHQLVTPPQIHFQFVMGDGAYPFATSAYELIVASFHQILIHFFGSGTSLLNLIVAMVNVHNGCSVEAQQRKWQCRGDD
jgi:hypothetical protein